MFILYKYRDLSSLEQMSSRIAQKQTKKALTPGVLGLLNSL